MKTIFNKQKRSVAGVLIALTALTTALTGCQEDFELDLPLAVSARELSLTKDAGSTHVLVYSNGDWTARFTRPVKWASLNKLQGYGNNEIVFTYSANYGISRKIGVVFEKGSLTDTVMFSQAGAITDASLSFSKPAVTLLKSRSQIFTPISTNLRYCIDDLEASVTYYDNDGLPNDPVTVLTRAEEGEEGGEGEGGDVYKRQASPCRRSSWTAMPKRTKVTPRIARFRPRPTTSCPTPTRSVTTWRTTFPSRRAPSGF